MNKITVKGSRLADLTSLLRARVCMHEGVDLDVNILQLVKDEKGVVYLRGGVKQPSYDGYVCINISEGDEKNQGEQKDQAKSASVRGAIDANAVAGELSECYSLCSSELFRMLRCIGDEVASFVFDSSGLTATIGNTRYVLDAQRLDTGLFIPTYTVLTKKPAQGVYYPLCTFDVKPLQEMLQTVIPLSKATYRSPMLKGRAIHIVLEQGNNGRQATLESVSATAGIRNRKKSGFSFVGDIPEQFGGSLHLAIDKSAAERLLDMLKTEGKQTVVAYDVDKKTLFAWCGSETISIPVEDVSECDFPENEIDTGINLERLPLLGMLNNVLSTGSSTVVLTVSSSGLLTASDPEGRYSSSLPCSPAAFREEVYSFTLPVSTLIAVVRSHRSKFFNMYFDGNDPLIYLEDSASGIEGIVKKL